MGYKRGALILEWPEDSEFSGLEIRMKRLSIKQVMRVEKLSDLRKESTGGDVERVYSDLLDAIGLGLLSWNLEEDGEVDGEQVTMPVPATREALDDCDVDMILALVRAWTSAAAAVPLASRPSSPTGEPAEPPDELGSWLAWEQQQNPESLPEPVSS